ncbi:MAG: enoyl-CoA hydratase/isomerase family protein [Acidobacteria bacterium]|nr:enoyl-CoA hydratase/isomerase family protein [Acidobacteriota bacterium]
MTKEPIQLEVRDRLHLLRLSHGANALDEVLLDALHEALDRQAEAGAPPLVLASAHPTVFCPGLDLRRLDGMPRDLFRPFLRRYNALLRRLLTYPGPTVAAIGGHAVAGGSLLVLACDRRVMARAGARLGLSEINLGIPLPAGTIAMLLALYPTRAVEQLVLDGDGFGGERALELGFVERVADAEQVEDEACRLALRLAARPAAAFGTSKQFLHHGIAETMERRDEAELVTFLDHWYSAETQDRIGALVGSMARR